MNAEQYKKAGTTNGKISISEASKYTFSAQRLQLTHHIWVGDFAAIDSEQLDNTSGTEQSGIGIGKKRWVFLLRKGY